jgi:hypothetical protein
MTGPVIRLLEAGERGLYESWRPRLAALLGIRPDDLMNSKPNKG